MLRPQRTLQEYLLRPFPIESVVIFAEFKVLNELVFLREVKALLVG